MIRVLLVDDEVQYVQTLAKVLRQRGLEVITAFDGAEAVDRVRGNEVEVVVLDQRMPGLDGLATLAEIRLWDPALPVIILSGHADLERVRAALVGGAADFLLKPCPVETLVAAIEGASERRAIARDALAAEAGALAPPAWGERPARERECGEPARAQEPRPGIRTGKPHPDE